MPGTRSTKPPAIRRLALFGLGVVSVLSAAAQASGYPARPVRVIVSLSPGSGGDVATRTLTPGLSEAFGHQFIVDNRVGFSGNIGAEIAARAAPDGHTLLVVYAGNAISQTFHSKLGYSLEKDFDAVGQFASLPLALVVHPKHQVKTVAELVTLARSRPKGLYFASPGNGSLPHLAAEFLKVRGRIDIVHVPYKGTAPAITELVAGQTALTFAAIPTALPHLNSGRLRMLGISSAQRSRLVPEWPTIAESGLPGFDVSQWYGIVAPAGTPKPVVARLNQELTRIVRTPEISEALARRGVEPTTNDPQAFGRYIRAEIAKWASAVKASGARPD